MLDRFRLPISERMQVKAAIIQQTVMRTQLCLLHGSVHLPLLFWGLPTAMTGLDRPFS
jgi:hypothetical protein